MKRPVPLTAVSLMLGALLLLPIKPASAAGDTPSWSADIGEIRQAAALIPGARPVRVNVIKIAESLRTKNFSVKGAAPVPSVQARTAYQVVYPSGYVMIDSGMDLKVHRFFGRGTVEPFYPEADKRRQAALLGATSIVVTHEHADHVAGIIHSPYAARLAAKTVLTRMQVDSLLHSWIGPQ